MQMMRRRKKSRWMMKDNMKFKGASKRKDKVQTKNKGSRWKTTKKILFTKEKVTLFSSQVIKKTDQGMGQGPLKRLPVRKRVVATLKIEVWQNYKWWMITGTSLMMMTSMKSRK